MFYNKIFNIKNLLEAGVHYGHQSRRWNPKMAPYIYGVKNKIHIIDLAQTALMLDKALYAIKSVAARNGRILFVSTKKNSGDLVALHAKRAGQYYVNKRWLGGMLSNWATVSASVHKMEDYGQILRQDTGALKKKERLILQRHYDKLESVLGGIRTMGGLPDMIFVVDAHKNKGAITEARKMGILVCAVVDTNSDPTGIDFVIPGNDDARKSIEIFMKLAAEASIAGTYEALAAANLELDETSDIVALKEELNQKRDVRKKNHHGITRLKPNKRAQEGQ